MKHNAFGIFNSYANASEAVHMLQAKGFTQDNISLLTSENTRDKVIGLEKASKAPEGAATGGAVGGTLGAIAAGLAAVASLAIPGVGIFVAGPIVAALAGAGAGAAIGGLAGGLIGLGITEHEAKFYEEQVKEGGILLAVHADDADGATTAKKIIDACGAVSAQTK